VKSGACSSLTSASVKIKVNPLPQAPTLDKTKVYCKSDVNLDFSNIKFTSPTITSGQQNFIFYDAGGQSIFSSLLLNNASGNYQVAFFDGECLGDKLTFNFPNDIKVNPGPILNNTLNPVSFCLNEKPDLDLVESKITLPEGVVSWYLTATDPNSLNKSTQIVSTNSTFYISVKHIVTNCVNETRFKLDVKIKSGENIQLNPAFGLCSNVNYTVADLEKSVTNDLSKGTIRWYNNNIIPTVGQPLSKDDKVDFSKPYYAMYVPNDVQLCSSNDKNLLSLNIKNANAAPTLVFTKDKQEFCFEPAKYVSDINISPYSSTVIQVFSSATDVSTKLDGNEKLVSGTYYYKSKIDLPNTICYSDNASKIEMSIYKPTIQTVTHFPNCGKKNGFIELTTYPQNATISWFKNDIQLNNGTSTIKDLDRGVYKLVVNADGCEVTTKTELDECIPLEIPQIVTPNNDYKNDTWELGYYAKYPSISIQIFNRYGNQIYQSQKPYMDDWDGKNKDGEYIPTGTYFYIIDKGNDEPVVSGFVEFVK
jgi:gliding motility-associated-like protein